MMHDLADLEKQQVGLRLPKYLIDDIDAFTKQFSLNRTDVIVEAVKAYVGEQKARMAYARFDDASRELSEVIKSGDTKMLQTLDGLIDELEHS